MWGTSNLAWILSERNPSCSWCGQEMGLGVKRCDLWARKEAQKGLRDCHSMSGFDWVYGHSYLIGSEGPTMNTVENMQNSPMINFWVILDLSIACMKTMLVGRQSTNLWNKDCYIGCCCCGKTTPIMASFVETVSLHSDTNGRLCIMHETCGTSVATGDMRCGSQSVSLNAMAQMRLLSSVSKLLMDKTQALLPLCQELPYLSPRFSSTLTTLQRSQSCAAHQKSLTSGQGWKGILEWLWWNCCLKTVVEWNNTDGILLIINYCGFRFQVMHLCCTCCHHPQPDNSHWEKGLVDHGDSSSLKPQGQDVA